MQLIDFKIVRPPFEMHQEGIFDWLTQAHVQAEKLLHPELCEETFAQEIRERIARVCCKKEKISKRGHVFQDLLHADWSKMQIYTLKDSPIGKTFQERSHLYSKHAQEVFEQFYPLESQPPEDLIHVTCTGYNAPSAAQRLVVKRGWEQRTLVTHAYHMGCLGSIPGIRMAQGFCSAKKTRVDLAHTEVCTLHLNPTLHSAEQLVGQSLFADGFIKYAVVPSQPEQKGFEILAVYEEMLPDTLELMTWECQEWGLKMTLSKEIPQKIALAIIPFLKRLLAKAFLDKEEALSTAVFAIHPGGPKIITRVQSLLSLAPWQVAASEEILFEYGNMSSATLPHIWERILHSEKYPDKTLVVAMGFGPGLCIGGIVLQKNA